jgi:hypothetical protein
MSPGGLGGTIIGCIIGGGLIAGMFIWFFIRRRQRQESRKEGDEENGGDTTRDGENSNTHPGQENGNTGGDDRYNGSTDGDNRRPVDEENNNYFNGGAAIIGQGKGKTRDNQSNTDGSATSSQIVDENNDPVPHLPKGKDGADRDTLSSRSDPEHEDKKIEVDDEYYNKNRPKRKI